jgi:glycosyltransferase involved in cell wall biosynthesis
MACNLPIVATDVGDVADQLDGVTHSTVCESDTELADAIVDVLRAGERSNGRETAREYSLDRMGDRIVDVYESVLAEDAETTPVGRRAAD